MNLSGVNNASQINKNSVGLRFFFSNRAVFIQREKESDKGGERVDQFSLARDRRG